MERDVIIACDFQTGEETIKFLDLFKEKKPFVKIGMELFYSEGPDIVRKIRERGHKIFLDLKLHDIPNTVKKAYKSLSRLDVDILNVHSAGGIDMMKGALEGLQDLGDKRPLVIAITQLTSTSQEVLENELLINKPINDVIIEYAKNAKKAGLDGVVCSPLESKIIHENCGNEFLTVTPGVRLAGDDKGDQKRVTTPAKAKELGSNFIVVGRSITASNDPVAAYNRCLSEFL